MAEVIATGASKMGDDAENITMPSGCGGGGEGRAGRVGKEGSLKHRILSRPSIKFAGSSPDESMQSTSNGSPSPASSSSATTTPVASPASSTHSSNGLSDGKNDGAAALKRPRPTENTAERSPRGAKSDFTVATSPNAAKSAAVVVSPQFSPPAPTAYQPHQFARGSLIQLANGSLKTIEQMSSDDFIRSAAASPNLKVDFSEIARIDKAVKTNGKAARPTMVVYFRSKNRNACEVAVEACEDHPFFVLGKGWSSACPGATMGRFGLKVLQLNTGDTCISLSYKEQLTAPLAAVGLNPASLAQQPTIVMPPPPKPTWTSPPTSGSKRQNTATYSPFIVPTSSREGNGVGQSKSPTAITDENSCRRGTVVSVGYPPGTGGGSGQWCAAGTSSSTNGDMQRSFSLNGADVNAFRRWSAPEDDRFLDGFQK